MNRHFSRQSILVVLILCTIVFGSLQAQGAESARQVTLAVNPGLASVAYLWLAKDAGLFDKYGLNVRFNWGYGQNLPATLIAGEVPVATGADAQALNAQAAGQDIVIASSAVSLLAQELTARGDVKSPQQIKGKRFGAYLPGSPVHVSTLIALKYMGLDPKRDQISIISIGPPSDRLQALLAGSVDVTILDSGSTKAFAGQGLHVLLDLVDLKIPYNQASLLTTKTLLRNQRALLEAIFKGSLEGIAYVLRPENRSKALALMNKQMRLGDPEKAAPFYEALLRSYARKPYASVEGVRSVQAALKEVNPKVAGVDPAQVIDDSLLREIDASGFIDSLYKK
ncbi:MAG: ABC transporter substrate-binding protein [Candidatus Tectomicrobia bacterium]|uniref:ABC transporter substrate-binding protein n=1 Tax=Tectimicrobiota bacterium TaxID=2528274 RepID=A0A932GRB0_UNCTE|nr:ABC transporter substrate-binding protein [Candidatus Tectomicrobia bacterium]